MKKIRYPCSKCRNMNYILFEEVKVHLYRKGFVLDYWYWTCHGENNLTFCGKFYAQCSTSTAETGNNEPLDRFEPWFMMLLVQSLEWTIIKRLKSLQMQMLQNSMICYTQRKSHRG